MTSKIPTPTSTTTAYSSAIQNFRNNKSLYSFALLMKELIYFKHNFEQQTCLMDIETLQNIKKNYLLNICDLARSVELVDLLTLCNAMLERYTGFELLQGDFCLYQDKNLVTYNFTPEELDLLKCLLPLNQNYSNSIINDLDVIHSNMEQLDNDDLDYDIKKIYHELKSAFQTYFEQLAVRLSENKNKGYFVVDPAMILENYNKKVIENPYGLKDTQSANYYAPALKIIKPSTNMLILN